MITGKYSNISSITFEQTNMTVFILVIFHIIISNYYCRVFKCGKKAFWSFSTIFFSWDSANFKLNKSQSLTRWWHKCSLIFEIYQFQDIWASEIYHITDSYYYHQIKQKIYAIILDGLYWKQASLSSKSMTTDMLCFSNYFLTAWTMISLGERC